ncbi:Por secretion system C-terminal sorting domain-containing protein [Epilithonimonas zeae]|uniref:Por secretion system C-terminal sorting domain-containing protein n=2 Tax=Epilithonimonas zeae TaxID=1416779 RepID=A0A1N6ENV0_9FLAO|nr:Por secretion system C-terminal sorting domain-containing protein [Epilithonimonas zeae]
MTNTKVMKTIIFFISVLFSLTFSAQSTYIPMPDGYGLYGGNGFVPKQSTPFYESGGYIYCYTKTLAGGYYTGKIAKVNVINNQVTILSGEIPNAETPTFIRMYNGKIYFKTSSYNLLYQIDPLTNSMINFSQTYLGNSQVLGDYAFINDKLYFTPNGVAQTYNFLTNTMTGLKYYDTPTHFYYLRISGIHINNSDIYLTGNYFDEGNSEKIFKVNDNTGLISLISTTNNVPSTGYYFRDLSRFVKLNNSLLKVSRINENGTIVNKIESINLTNNNVNTNYFTYQGDNNTTPLQPYIFNNMVYITDGDKVYMSDGSSTPVLTSIPAFSTTQTTSQVSPEYPVIAGAGQNPVYQANNKVIGQRNYTISSGSTPSTSELWISDGTVSGTRFFKNIKSYNQACSLITIFANNSFYYHEMSHYEGNYLYKTDATIGGTYPVYNFGNYVSIDSNFYSSGKYLYYSNSYENPGLYKLDLSQLSQLSVKDISNDNQLILSPNPAKSFITINGKKSMEAFDYNIMDLNGNIIKSGNARYNEKIDIERLETGNYFLIINPKDGQKTNLKLIKR